MLLSIIKGIGSILGFGGGQTVQNAVTGIAVHSLFLTGSVYFVHHYNDMVDVHVPLWNLAIGGIAAYLYIEYLRRHLPGAP